MSKLSKKIGIGAGAVVGVLAILGIVIAVQPSTYHVERSITVAAPADVAFAEVVDFRKWDAWSPWAKLDPNMKTTYEGTQGEVGASYAWKGNKEVGEGKMTITAIKPAEKVDIKLEFKEPFVSVCSNAFTVSTSGNETKITWSMDGTNDFMGKAFSLFMDMDAAIGNDFNKGLADLKKVAEASAKAKAQPSAAN